MAAGLICLLLAGPAAADVAPAQREVIVGALKAFPPYYELTDDGRPSGFAVDAMNAVAKRAGLKITYRVLNSWAEMIEGLRTGTIDVIPSLGITEGRKVFAAFTTPVETLRISLFVRGDTGGVGGIEDLAGRTVAVVRTNAARRRLARRGDIQLKVFERFNDALFALLSAEVDGLAYPESVTWKLARQARVDHQLKVVEPLFEIKRAIAVRKDRTALLAALDATVREFVASPEYRALYVTWFGQAQPYWTAKRVAWLMGLTIVALLILVVWWRYRVGVQLIDRLRESDERLRGAIESLQEGFVLYDADDRIVAFNEVYRRINPKAPEYLEHGMTFEDLVRANIANGRIADAQGREEEFLRERMEQHRNPGPPIVRRFADDKWYILKETRTPEGGIALTFTDINELKQVEQALRESENVLNSIIENVPVALLIKDRNHLVERANSTYLEWYGLDAEAMIGRRTDELQNFQSAEDAARMNAQELEVLTTGKIQFRRVERAFADGRVHTIGVTKFPIYDQQGAIAKVGSVGVDLTAEVEALREAERANEAKSSFLATMSHEFRTPLNAIMGFSEMIRARYFGDIGNEKYAEYADLIHDAGDHMLALVNDVLDISVIEAGKRRFTPSPIAVRGLLEDCVREVGHAAGDKRVAVSLDVPDGLPVLNADERSVTQIVLNLLSNAVKFTGPEGRVTVSARAKDGRMAIVVADTGIGIPADKIATVVEPFSQVNADSHIAQEGTGLGLSIVKSLVDAHHGTLEIKSELDKGTTVTVEMPVGQNPPPDLFSTRR